MITPCLSADRFLKETIESVLAQSYGKLEVLIVDGGSTDASADIARSFEPHVRLISLPGSSQPEAINEGFERSTGEFFTFLNADDTLESDAIALSVAALAESPAAPFAYGDAVFIDETGGELGAYPTRAFSLPSLASQCFICQPATLMRSEAFERIGRVRPQFDTAFDYDLWIRLALADGPPVQIQARLARARMHVSAKTFRDRERGFHEAIALLREHFGYVPFSWVHAYAGYLCDGRDQFFEASPGSLRRTLRTLAVGVRVNRRGAGTFFAEWARESWRLWYNARRYAGAR